MPVLLSTLLPSSPSIIHSNQLSLSFLSASATTLVQVTNDFILVSSLPASSLTSAALGAVDYFLLLERLLWVFTGSSIFLSETYIFFFKVMHVKSFHHKYLASHSSHLIHLYVLFGPKAQCLIWGRSYESLFSYFIHTWKNMHAGYFFKYRWINQKLFKTVPSGV